jgi:aldose 1-epimerase
VNIIDDDTLYMLTEPEPATMVPHLAGNFLTGKPKDMPLAGKGGLFYKQYGGLCLEAGAFPNAINTPTFPSMVVRPGDMYSNRVSYDFSCA